MQKSFYGCTYINSADREFSKHGSIELEYYKIKNYGKYGIEILKRECCNEIISVERSNVSQITGDEGVINNLLATLKNNKVLPCTLEYVVSDII